MYVNLSKKFINTHIASHIPSSNLGRKPKVKLWQVLKAIIYRLKTGCQWRELPIVAFFGTVSVSWNTVYYYFNKWSKQGILKRLWTKILSLQKSKLDLSSVQLDGSHTAAKRGGQAVAYQGRKKAKTTNALFLTDKNGLPLAMSSVVSGNHNDLFEIKEQFLRMLSDIQKAGIPTKGLFLNADAGFDCSEFRETCSLNEIIANIDFNKRNSKKLDYDYIFDDLLYKERFSVERTNAWIDAFKALLVRFEKTTDTWQGQHYLAFILMLLRSETDHF
jgi:transposase